MGKIKRVCRIGFNGEDPESLPSLIIADLTNFAMTSVKQSTYKNINEMVREYIYSSGAGDWIWDWRSIPMFESWLGQDLDHEEYVREFIQSDLHILSILVPRSS